jgi:transcriptional regulator of acetoin/glycerol metabolism
MVQAALDRSKGRLEDAAKILGISRKGLFLKRRRWGLQN